MVFTARMARLNVKEKKKIIFQKIISQFNPWKLEIKKKKEKKKVWQNTWLFHIYTHVSHTKEDKIILTSNTRRIIVRFAMSGGWKTARIVKSERTHSLKAPDLDRSIFVGISLRAPRPDSRFNPKRIPARRRRPRRVSAARKIRNRLKAPIKARD